MITTLLNNLAQTHQHMKNIHGALFALFLISSSLSGCIGNDDDSIDYSDQISKLEEEINMKNQTIANLETQISSYQGTVDGLEDAISDATMHISYLQESIFYAEEYRDSLLLMLNESNNTLVDTLILLEFANETIDYLEVSLAENQSILSQAGMIISDLITGWDSTNYTLDSYLLAWGSTNTTLDLYLEGWNETNMSIEPYLEGWNQTNSTVQELILEIIELNDSMTQCNSVTTYLFFEECMSRNSMWGHIPFINGTNVSIGQSYMGGFTHQGDSMYSVDFIMNEGIPVVAFREGKIKAIKEDSDINCIEENISIEDCTHGNYVIIDHGDFTFSYYLHLQQYSVEVEVGDSVGAGHQIGKIGNTGYSTEAHLHLEVTNGFGLGDSVMILFEELRNLSGGVPFAGLNVISENTNNSFFFGLEYSDCPLDLFYFRGVELFSYIPCSVVDLDTDYNLEGRVLIEGHTLVIGMYESESENWDYRMVQPNATGHFDTTINWSSDSHSNYSYLMLTIGNPEGTNVYDGWWTSVEIIIE